MVRCRTPPNGPAAPPGTRSRGELIQGYRRPGEIGALPFAAIRRLGAPPLPQTIERARLGRLVETRERAVGVHDERSSPARRRSRARIMTRLRWVLSSAMPTVCLWLRTPQTADCVDELIDGAPSFLVGVPVATGWFESLPAPEVLAGWVDDACRVGPADGEFWRGRPSVRAISRM
jgi:hypothetical protein